jgi:hypothetical protein
MCWSAALSGQPRPVAQRPSAAITIDVAVAQQRLDHTMAARRASAAQIITGADQIPQPLLRWRGSRHKEKLSRAIQTHELLGVAPIGLHAVTCPNRDQRRRDHIARHAHAAQQPLKLIATRARLICHRQPLRSAQSLDEATNRALGVLHAHYLGLTPTRRQRCRHERELVLINRDPRPYLCRSGRANVWHGWSSFVCGTRRSGR